MTLARILLFSAVLATPVVASAAPCAAAPQATPPQSPPQSEPAPQASAPAQDSSKPSDQETNPEKPAEGQAASPESKDASKPAQEPPSEPKEAKPDQPAAPNSAPQAPASLEQPVNPAPPAATPKPPTPATSSKKVSRKRKTVPARKVVRDGGTSDAAVELSPGMSQQQATTQKQTADQLIAATDANLKKIAARDLKANEQETVSQIRNYLEQAKSAAKDGDPERSRNLAFKAHLLSVELLPH